MKKRIILMSALVIGVCALFACVEPTRPQGAKTVAELLASPVYDTTVEVYGEVDALEELLCPCFILRYDDASIDVWYDLMLGDDGETMASAVDVSMIENRDWVLVTGQLQSSTGSASSKTFYLSAVEKLD